VGESGSFTTTPLSSHAKTNIDVIRRFLDVKVDIEEVRRGVERVIVTR
jgi:RNA 3'-terminal phosphate cyclase